MILFAINRTVLRPLLGGSSLLRPIKEKEKRRDYIQNTYSHICTKYIFNGSLNIHKVISSITAALRKVEEYIDMLTSIMQ